MELDLETVVWMPWERTSRDITALEVRSAMNAVRSWLEDYGCDPIPDGGPPAWARLRDGRYIFRVDMLNHEGDAIAIIPTIDEDGAADGRSRCVRVRIVRTHTPIGERHEARRRKV